MAAAQLSRDGGLAAADAIRTTDTVAKIVLQAGGEGYMVGGMAKGAGMLAPGLATMLVRHHHRRRPHRGELDAVLRAATAHDVRPARLRRLHVHQRHRAAAGQRRLRGRARISRSSTQTVTEVCADLPGSSSSTPRAPPRPSRSRSSAPRREDDAVEVGRSVARNNLLKCAIHGEDPNWGRVLSAVGTTDAVFEPDRLNVAINGVWVCRDGAVGDDRDKVDMRPRDVTITVDLSAGPHTATVHTTDLTADYVHENSAYSS